jgi:hypothetical protein
MPPVDGDAYLLNPIIRDAVFSAMAPIQTRQDHWLGVQGEGFVP